MVRVPPVASKPVAPPSAAPDTLAWLEDRVIFEDSRLLVIDKPSGLAVHGGSSVSLGCIEALRVLRPAAKDLELAHRLDRGTSGVLLIAKRRSALRVLHGLLREGRIDKQYLALVKGRWPDATIEVNAPLVTRRVSGEARVKVDPEGKPAQSTFRVLEQYGKTASLLEVAIATGRTHQIRVHAAHVGHPLAGDDRYGDGDFNTYLETFGLQRMFLHAHSVCVRMAGDGRAVFGKRAATAGSARRADRARGQESVGPSGSTPSRLSARASQIRGNPISAVGSLESMRSNSATPSPSDLKLPAQS